MIQPSKVQITGGLPGEGGGDVEVSNCSVHYSL